MKAPRLLLSLLLPGLLLLAGCVTRYEVRLDALNAGPDVAVGKGQVYELVNRTPGVEDDALFFKEVCRHLDPVLRESGFRPAAEDTAADLRIAVKAYISDPLVETRTYSDPVYVNHPGYTRFIRVPVVNDQGKVVRYSYTRYWSPSRTRFAGYVDRDRQYTVYDKVLELSARPVKPDGETGGEIWSIRISLRSESTDYRSVLPYMVVAAQPYIGGRTRGEQVIVIKEDDPELQAYLSRVGDGR